MKRDPSETCYYSVNNETTMKPLFKLFKHHYEKYCSTHGRCLTEECLRQIGKSRLPINFM